MGLYQSLFYLGVAATVIGYETVLGTVRIQDYYRAKYTRWVNKTYSCLS